MPMSCRPSEEMVAKGDRYVLADLSAQQLLSIADIARDNGVLIFNVGATDDILREEECRANVFHTAPTRTMLADGLAQYLIWKQWPRWVLIYGSHERRPAFRRGAAPRRDALRRRDRRRKAVRGYRHRPADRFRRRPDPAADAGLHPGPARS